jgi:hypothetical protein
MPIKDIFEIRILPALAIARLGSSPEPMDNYEWEIPDRVGYRKIVPAETFFIDAKTGKILGYKKPDVIHFRDKRNRIRPVAPFLELWAKFEKKGPLVPLNMHHLKKLGLRLSDIHWRVLVGNNKAFRRTKDPNDKILVDTKDFEDFKRKSLLGKCKNFLPGKTIPYGFGQYIKPNLKFPEIRFRFTPAGGFVYGPPSKSGTPIKAAVYDPKHSWKGHMDDLSDPTVTAPVQIYANDLSARVRSLGYLDDECDGFIEVEINCKTKILSAFARVVAGPPSFAPDAVPVRTVNDDLEQALLGHFINEKVVPDDITNILRRALETVRLINTTVMNHTQGMAWVDSSGHGRASTPIMNPNVVDNLAILSRHELVLLSLESGSLAWFARILRDYDQVGDLTDEGRRRMPALMRGADGNHLALTRRMIGKIQKAADLFLQHKQVNTVKKIMK